MFLRSMLFSHSSDSILFYFPMHSSYLSPLMDTYPYMKCNLQQNMTQETSVSGDEIAKLKASNKKFAIQFPSCKCNAFNSMAILHYFGFHQVGNDIIKVSLMTVHIIGIPIVERKELFSISWKEFCLLEECIIFEKLYMS